MPPSSAPSHVFIYDAVMYNGDPLLPLRLHLMAPHVDVIIVVESRHTFTGRRKDVLCVDENRSQFEPYLHKIAFVIIEDVPPMPDDFFAYYQRARPGYPQPSAIDRDVNRLLPRWRETYQRWAAHDGVKAVVASKHVPGARHLVIVADCDEIVSPEMLHGLRTNHEGLALVDYAGGFLHLEMAFFYYNFRWRKAAPWYGASVMTSEFLEAATVMDMRVVRDVPMSQHVRPFLALAGFHLSYFMTVDQIQRKMDSFTHQVRSSASRLTTAVHWHMCAQLLITYLVCFQEFNTPKYRSRAWIERCIATGLDIFERSVVSDAERIVPSGMLSAADYFINDPAAAALVPST
jgi:beta-1,4-mannosyl-glycoprotein beta-1,4-N-acetylglucosaminyltransferase